MTFDSSDVLTWLAPRYDLLSPHRYLSSMGTPAQRLIALGRAIAWCSASAQLCLRSDGSAGGVAAAGWLKIRVQLDSAYEFAVGML